MTTLEIIASVLCSGLVLAMYVDMDNRERSRRVQIARMNADRREAHQRACAKAILEGRRPPPPPCTLTHGW